MTTQDGEGAAAVRLDADGILGQVNLLRQHAEPLELLDSFPDNIMLLNEYRQIIFVNRALCEYLQLQNPQDVYGLRPGELMHCVHANQSPGGCGTTTHCLACGAARTIVMGLDGRQVQGDCHVTRRDDAGRLEALDLRVWAAPLKSVAFKVIVFCAMDNSREKWLSTLERVFFHDVLNTAGGLQGCMEILQSQNLPDDVRSLVDMVYQQADSLIDQIRCQRELLMAERHQLSFKSEPMESLVVLRETVQKLSESALLKRRSLVVAPEAANLMFCSDRTLVSRVLHNLVKNALEATAPGARISLGCKAAGHYVQFWIHNPGVIPPDVQLQLYQRNFTTKGLGRGVGTYAARIYTENYLGGTVEFTSDPVNGTVFTVTLPLEKVGES